MTPTARAGAGLWIGARDSQEDACTQGRDPEGRLVLALGDGMGGHAGGEVASALAVEAAMARMTGGAGPDALAEAVSDANAAVAARMAEDPALSGMGSTLVLALIDGADLTWASVGDSHLFLLREGRTRKLNEDHSMLPVLMERAARGEMTVEEVARDRRRGQLRSVITGGEVQLLDLRASPVALRAGDAVVLASDGIDVLGPEPDLAGLIGDAAPDAAAEAVIDAVRAAARPHQDNVAVLVARLEAGGAPKSVATAPLAAPAAVPTKPLPDASADAPAASPTRSEAPPARAALGPGFVAGAVVLVLAAGLLGWLVLRDGGEAGEIVAAPADAPVLVDEDGSPAPREEPGAEPSPEGGTAGAPGSDMIETTPRSDPGAGPAPEQQTDESDE